MSCMWRKMEYVTPSYRTRDVANEQLSPMGHLWWHCGLTIDPPVMNGTSAENLWGTLSPPACFVCRQLAILEGLDRRATDQVGYCSSYRRILYAEWLRLKI